MIKIFENGKLEILLDNTFKDKFHNVIIIPKKKLDFNIVLESFNDEEAMTLEEKLDSLINSGVVVKDIFPNSIIMIPLIPSEKDKKPYYQQLSRECFEYTDDISYERIDETILNMVQNLKQYLVFNRNIICKKKITMFGYSSSAIFAQRFTLIHPEIVNNLIVGGNAGALPIPNEEFEYPLGAKDLVKLFNREFNYNAYKNIPQFHFLSQNEGETVVERNCKKVPMHDMATLERSVNANIAKVYIERLGEDFIERTEKCLEWYQKLEIDAEQYICLGKNHRDIFANNEELFTNIQEWVKLRKKSDYEHNAYK